MEDFALCSPEAYAQAKKEATSLAIGCFLV